MTQKEYGKFTAEQLETISGYISEARQSGQLLEPLFQQAPAEKLQSILGDDFTWCDLYELPFGEHVGLMVLILNWQNELKIALQSEDPQQHFFDFIADIDFDKNWQGGYQGCFEQSHLVGVLVSLVKTIKSIMVYHKSLNQLLEEVRSGNDKSLFDAVRIDRSMVACPTFAHRISMAELKNDKKFFIRLNKSLKGPSGKHMVGLEELRFMLNVLVVDGPDQITDKGLETLLVEKLKLYPKTPGAQKNLRKQYAYSKKINHRK